MEPDRGSRHPLRWLAASLAWEANLRALRAKDEGIVPRELPVPPTSVMIPMRVDRVA